MTPPARVIRLIGLGLLLLVGAMVALVLVFVRDYAVASLLLVGVSGVLFGSSLVIVLLRRMDAAGLHDASMSYYLRPPVANIAFVIVYSAMVIGAITLGIGFLSIGNVIGWGLMFCGAAGLILLTFEVWVARRPFDGVTDGVTDGDAQ
jgi:hypothetical protein